MASERPGERRTTSSAQQPRHGLPLPQRVILKRNALPKYGEKDNAWRAEVRSVSKCLASEYVRGSNRMKTVWVKGEQERQTCQFVCKGTVKEPQGLEMELVVNTGYQDPVPVVLQTFAVPSEEHLLDLRAYESTRRLELKPVAKMMTSQEDVVWVIDFMAEGRGIPQVRAMFERLARVSNELPSDWFKHLDCKARLTSQSGSTTFVQEISGGKPWTFTGFLASPEFQRAIGNLPDDATPSTQEATPVTQETRKSKQKQKKRKSSCAVSRSVGTCSQL